MLSPSRPYHWLVEFISGRGSKADSFPMRDLVSPNDAWGEVAIYYRFFLYVVLFLRLFGCACHTLTRASYNVIYLFFKKKKAYPITSVTNGRPPTFSGKKMGPTTQCTFTPCWRRPPHHRDNWEIELVCEDHQNGLLSQTAQITGWTRRADTSNERATAADE